MPFVERKKANKPNRKFREKNRKEEDNLICAKEIKNEESFQKIYSKKLRKSKGYLSLTSSHSFSC